jgi:hypothetical protein
MKTANITNQKSLFVLGCLSPTQALETDKTEMPNAVLFS